MANSNQRLLEFFTLMDNHGGVVVKDVPKLDLETYIQNYKGRTRFERLILIGSCSVTLCIDALKAAVAEAKKGKDVQRYRDAVELLQQAAPAGEPEATLDKHWIEAIEKANTEETKRLEQELKGYKNNLVRESIRMGNEDLGRHLEAIGDYSGASEAYTRMRPDVSSSKHLIDLSRHLINIYLQRRDWAVVISQLNKISGLQPQSGDDKAQATYVRVVHGVAAMNQCKYAEAAQSFLQADISTPAASYAEVASPNDVAVYGGLLALANMDRDEIQSRVLNNQQFRPFLELEPHVRRAITFFVNGRYSACLAVLEQYRPDYLLDLHLQKHVPEIYSKIRSKCISQYLIPFSCVTLDSLEEAFAMQGQSVQAELTGMIKSGVLEAKINTIDRVVTTSSPKARLQMQIKALETARDYEQEATERLRRMNITTADLEIRVSKKHGHGGSGLETWFDESSMNIMSTI